MGLGLQELPRRTVSVDAAAERGTLELWRHTLGLGGINSTPLPTRVGEAIAKLKPRLIRIFIQEFFAVCPAVGRYDWSRLDPYMDALAVTGAKIVAALTIKPRCLFPAIDQGIWQPNDVRAYQALVAAMVKRYSVDRALVTHWEIGNEPDIGEWGGCPYLIKDPRTYGEYYRITVQPILETFPDAKVGGPALAGADPAYASALAEYCRQHALPLDFISWHLYHDDPQQHAALVERMRASLTAVPDPRGRAAHPGQPAKPEMLVTEWSKGFDPVSVEELAFEPRRAAITAASILSMMDAGLHWSFYYHLWDQVAYINEFAPFFADPRIMTEHWNEVPHRFGLFGVSGEVRPQYFVYQMLARLGDRRLAAQCDDPSLRALAAVREPGQRSVLLVNHDRQQSRDLLTTLRFTNLTPGRKQLEVRRIDERRNWSAEQLELLPVEGREVDVQAQFRCQVYCPADSVALVSLDDKS